MATTNLLSYKSENLFSEHGSEGRHGRLASYTQVTQIHAQVAQAHCVCHITYEAKFRSENLLEKGNRNR